MIAQPDLPMPCCSAHAQLNNELEHVVNITQVTLGTHALQGYSSVCASGSIFFID